MEQEKVIEGLRGKVKGLEQTILTERMLSRVFERWLLDKKVDSSLGTALTSHSNTSGSVSVGRINLIRECDVVWKGIEQLEKLIL